MSNGVASSMYGRSSSGAHRLSVRLLAGATALAMAVLGFLGAPPTIHAQVAWRDPAALRPIPGGAAKGPFAPVLRGIEVDGTTQLSTSREPVLVWPDVPDGIGQATFRIMTLATSRADLLWSRTVAVNGGTARAQVPAGVLAQGGTYRWSVANAADPAPARGSFVLSVDTQRSSTQELWSVGALNIGETTGELTYTWAGRDVSAAGNSMGWSLGYRPSNRPWTGLPRGWDLMVSGSSPWESLRRGADGALTLTDTTGYTMTFTKTGTDLWAVAGDSREQAWKGGAPSQLQQSGDGTFTVTDPVGTVTRFPDPAAGGASHPTDVWSDNVPMAQQSWAGGRLRTLTDPVSGNQLAFFYAPSASCAITLDPGFVTAPDGALCGAMDSTGNATMLQYVDTPTGPQLGRIVDSLGMGMLAQVTDFGYDAVGRMTSLRSPLAAAALASGALPGVAESDPRTLTQIGYDDQARVAWVRLPAHLGAMSESAAERTERPTQQFSYAPFTVKTPGVDMPSGAVARVWTDSGTMRKLRMQDIAGRTYAFAYDGAGNLIRQEDVRAGLITQTRYDDQGRAVEQIGPTTNPSSSTAPRLLTQYDANAADAPWTGMVVRYWNAGGFGGVPSDARVGPEGPGTTTTVPTLVLNWTGNPLGGSGPWSARMTGRYVAPNAGFYRFAKATSAALWVNGRACAPTCTVPLPKGASAFLQVDVSSPTGAAAGVNVSVARYGEDGSLLDAAAPLKTADLRPDLNLPTASTVFEHVSGKGTRPLTSRFVYDLDTRAVVRTVSPSGASISRTYAPYDPTKGQFGQALTLTDAAGKVVTTGYSSPGQTLADCNGTPIVQTGDAQSLDAPGDPLGQVVAPDGSVVKVDANGMVSCSMPDDSGLVTTSSTSGTGVTATVRRSVMVAGNPLHAEQRSTLGGETTSAQSWIDITGQEWKSIDAHGTVTTREFDPVTGLVATSTDRTAKGEVRTTTYTYTASGDVRTVAIDGATIVTYTYDDTGRRVGAAYANGTTMAIAFDATSRVASRAYTFADGSKARDALTYSPSGRRLSHTITGPDGTATFDYEYNRDGRLIDTRATGTLAMSATRWQSDYAGPAGAAGDRAAQTITGPDGTTTSTFAYGENNRPIATTKPAIAGDLPADAAGRITRIGSVDITRNALGQIISAAEGTRTISFQRDASGVIGRRYVNTNPADPADVTARLSGNGLVLDGDGRIVGTIAAADGASVALNAAGDAVRWSYTDLLGDTTWRAGGDGIPAVTRLYGPDGDRIAGPAQSRIRTPLDLANAGQGWQSEAGGVTVPFSAGLVVLGARTYAPDLGRWLEPDPLASLNRYEYANGDPINQIDPSGNVSFGDIVGLVGAVVVGVGLGALTAGVGLVGGIGGFYAALFCGFVSSAAGNVMTQVANHTPIDWQEVKIAGIQGLVISAVTFGIGLGIGKWTAARRAARMDPVTVAQLNEASERIPWGYKPTAADLRNVARLRDRLPDSTLKRFREYSTAKQNYRSFVAAEDGHVYKMGKQVKFLYAREAGANADSGFVTMNLIQAYKGYYQKAVSTGVKRGEIMKFGPWYTAEGSKLTGRVIKPVADVPARGGDFADLVKQYRGIAELQADSAAAWRNGSFVIVP